MCNYIIIKYKLKICFQGDIIMENIKKIHMGKAKCSVDLGDGSERGEYVSQDYILSRIGRPMRSISLMYCYYPFDKEWPARISDVIGYENVNYQWGFPYDDYFPYTGGIGGDRNSAVFQQMRDIRRHGQDVTLTITIDPHVSDEQIAAIGEDLSTFGRLFLRINHECTGNWFSFTKRATYQEIADFYCRATRIIREKAPNVQNILCAGGVDDIEKGEVHMEKEFTEAIRETDIWSVDKYLALHWGWPYDICDETTYSHTIYPIRETFDLFRASYERFCQICGGTKKPMVLSEINADGDVTGAYGQAEMMKRFIELIRDEKAEWLDGFSFYQFRDRGRLGLEIQDPNNENVGIEQPVMEVFREIINDPWFMPEMAETGSAELPVTLRWGNSEDAEGIAVPMRFDGEPCFCELYFEDDSNLMMEINGRWFYKAPETKFVDLMPAFYGQKIGGAGELTLKIFAPPASGENDITNEDGRYNYYYTLEKLPRIRISSKPVAKCK